MCSLSSTVNDDLVLDTLELRKARGAFFTPPAIAAFLAHWALAGDPSARVLDPTCGEAVFLLAAAEELIRLGAVPARTESLLHGVDVHKASLAEAVNLLNQIDASATLVAGDFFEQIPPTSQRLGAELPLMDAVIGNPPFVRYQEHRGLDRKRSVVAAWAQGVRLSGLASSWAALLVHACSFLKPEGRVAMVLPAELLTVGYAEPIRIWLRERFASVHLVLFDQLQFADVEEHVVLLVAQGTGGCDAFTLHQVRDAEELRTRHMFDANAVTPHTSGKWTDLLLTTGERSAFRRLADEHFVPLRGYGRPELGTVTGSNKFFALSEPTRKKWRIDKQHLTPMVPPGSKHLGGERFTVARWEKLRDRGERVWMLNPVTDKPTGGLARYLANGVEDGVPDAYKCRIREPWWRPPVVRPPDLFFTYMSHRGPRLVENEAGVTFVNSMHGLRLGDDAPSVAKTALPLLALNSVSMLGGELFGRSYGGGILKMEPKEAAQLPVPSPDLLTTAWRQLEPHRDELNKMLVGGAWEIAVAAVDEALLIGAGGIDPVELHVIRDAAIRLRRRRTGCDF